MTRKGSQIAAPHQKQAAPVAAVQPVFVRPSARKPPIQNEIDKCSGCFISDPLSSRDSLGITFEWRLLDFLAALSTPCASARFHREQTLPPAELFFPGYPAADDLPDPPRALATLTQDLGLADSWNLQFPFITGGPEEGLGEI
ncbi:hypothetical protein PAPYR_1060 [Paratrimastix pyriformis]|uniref:Uncharacterized protein n=1 Tax=Paratrimastix pyriformis TaxID=342808 RepID=A0ABQ8UXW7_9EUKA|nr:hypothetical protein PAPYR_1060 [Paratrimastix pyriformis]